MSRGSGSLDPAQFGGRFDGFDLKPEERIDPVRRESLSILAFATPVSGTPGCVSLAFRDALDPAFGSLRGRFRQLHGLRAQAQSPAAFATMPPYCGG